MGWRVWVKFASFGIQDLRSTTAIVTVAGCGARNWIEMGVTVMRRIFSIRAEL